MRRARMLQRLGVILLLFVAMGDLIQQGVTQQDASVTGTVLAVGTFAVLTMVLGYLNPLAAAREQGIRSLGEVELAVLEADGKISFFTRS
jgi:uncharacterized membrane protein YcaP (DUF421 family)